MADRIYIMPVWLRSWHWLNALMFVVLIASGVSLHFASPDASYLIRFDIARIMHNVAGITISVLYVAYLIANVFTGNGRSYIPPTVGLMSELNAQNAYAASGVFKGEAPPVIPSKERKFNVLQQLTYLAVMYIAMPVLIISGIAFMFPELAPDEILGVDGLLPIAVLHYSIGFLLTLFLMGHMYMGTMGTTVGSGFKMMITGWHDEH